jgi:pimeloyl-ACP methyl ester carboxylesterase
METVTVDGVSLEVKVWGGSTKVLPILMLHEGLGSVALWRDFPERLATTTGRQVVAWSRQGYGNSTSVTKSYQTDFMHVEAECVAPLMDVLGLDQAHMFGHSDGASIALLFAANYPERVASLILEAPHIFVEPMTTTAIADFGARFPESGMERRMAKYHREPVAMFWRWHDVWIDGRFSVWNIEDSLSRISVPTLLIQGYDDEYGRFAQLDRISASAPHCTQLRLNGCGHSPHRDQPDAVLGASRKFLPSPGVTT